MTVAEVVLLTMVFGDKHVLMMVDNGEMLMIISFGADRMMAQCW